MPNNTDDFAGIKFLGARVIRVSAGIEWGQSSSTANIELVEDDTEGDKFEKPDPGTPAYFTIGSLQFGGIVQRWQESHGFNGNPTFSVTLLDPREILAGSQIITDNYTGSTLNIPNIINAFGAYPFGVARTNEIGMPWENIRPVLQDYTFTYSNYNYVLDLSEIPIAPLFYRIEGVPTVSVLEAIEQVCEDSGLDMFVILQPGNIIKVRTVSRIQEPPSAISNINTFVQQNTGLVNEYAFGRELNNDTNTSVFLFGHPVHELYESDTVRPFWGYDLNGQPIISSFSYTSDIRHLLIPELGGTYTTNANEIALVLGGNQELWEFWLSISKPAILSKLGIQPIINREKLQQNRFLFNLEAIAAKRLADFKLGITVDAESKLKRLFEHLQQQGQSLYGIQFAVKIPAANRYLDANTGKYVFSLQPVASAWKEGVSFGEGPIGLPEEAEEFFQDGEGKFLPFVKFSITDGSNVDLSRYNPTDYFYRETPTYNIFGIQTGLTKEIWIRCNIGDEIFLSENGQQYFGNGVDNSLGYDGNAISNQQTGTGFDLEDYFVIISLDAPIFATNRGSTQRAREILRDQIIKWNTDNPGNRVDGEVILGVFDNDGGIQSLFALASSLPLVPNSAAIPLQNNQQYYGPWAVGSGKTGRVYAFQDTDINPWNYGSLSNMNIVALDTIYKMAVGQQIIEAGRVVLAGLPIRNLGDALIGGQPTITSINIDFGIGGVTTEYQMQTFTMKFGDFGKQRFRNLAKMGRFTRRLHRYVGKIAQDLSNPSTTANIGTGAINGGALGWKNAVTMSNSYMRAATALPEMSAAGFFAGRAGSNHVGVSSAMNFLANTNTGVSGQFEKTAGSNASSLFRAISTNPNDQHFPHFKHFGSGEALRPNVTDLNPFRAGNDMQILSGSGNNIAEEYDPDFARPIALRGPLVMAGWGYDTAGNPVPNAGSGYPEFPSNEFASGYLTEPKLWKTGPVDLRWDDSRGVWSASSSVLAIVMSHHGSGGVEDTTFSGGRPKYTCRTAPLILNEAGQILYNPEIALYNTASGAVDFEVFNIRENVNDIHTLASGSPVLLYSYGKFKFMNEHVRTMIRSSNYQFF